MDPYPAPQIVLPFADAALISNFGNRIAAVLVPDTQSIATLGQDAHIVALTLSCPVHDDQTVFQTEAYIARCKQEFLPLLSNSEDVYYLRQNRQSFAALRAAVLALTDLTGRSIIAGIHAADDGHMADDTDCIAAIGVLQRIGVSQVIVTADTPEALQEALAHVAPYARLSLGVRCPAAWLRSGISFPAAEVFFPAHGESASDLLAALTEHSVQVIPRDHDDVLLAPDGRNAHFIDAITDISDEIHCDHRLSERLIEQEDENACIFKLLLEEAEDVTALEESHYMISRPVCLCAENPLLLERALRVYRGLAIYDATWPQEESILRHFNEKYGMILL